jgi:hypothetical protein
MLNAKRAGDLPEVQDVSNPHHRTGRPATASRALRQSAISSNAGSGPNPTGASLINLLPEARYVSVIQKDSLTSTATSNAAILATAVGFPGSRLATELFPANRTSFHQPIGIIQRVMFFKVAVSAEKDKAFGMGFNLGRGNSAGRRPQVLFRGVFVVKLKRAYAAVVAATLATAAKLSNQLTATAFKTSHALRSLSIRRRNNSAVEMPSRSASAFNHSSWGCVRDSTSLIMRTSVILW